MKKSIKVIGCGVSGLTVAIVLLEHGYDVEIITEKLPHQTTSSKAAAIWFPYEVMPKEKVRTWCKESYAKFKELCQSPNSGVSIISLTILVKKEEDAWWKNALPKQEIRKCTKEELPLNYPHGFKMNVPLVETPIYLDFLFNKFKSLNGKLSVNKINDLSELNTKNEIIVNCTGLSSRELVNDKLLFPIHGQIIKAEPQTQTNCIAADFTFGENMDKIACVIPRNDCLILGGTAIKGKEDTDPTEEFTEGIIERCKEIDPSLSNIKIKSVEVGLRPGRSEIRIEREGNIIHNYGHGGGGFTVSWGCANEVIKILEK